MFAPQSKQKLPDMKRFHLFLAVALMGSTVLQAQAPEETIVKETKKWKPKLGVAFGYNIPRLRGSTPDFKPRGRNGFNLAAFYAPTSGNGLGYRTEIIFSRQGFSFDDSSRVLQVSQDYIYMPHLTTFTVAHRVQLQAGGQIGYLLHAKKEDEKSGTDEQQLTRLMNRFDYGATLGMEIYPFKGLIIGGRCNISLGNPYKKYEEPETTTSQIPLPLPFNPADFKGRNGVIRFFVGYRF
jgi:hypothetical protein